MNFFISAHFVWILGTTQVCLSWISILCGHLVGILKTTPRSLISEKFIPCCHPVGILGITSERRLSWNSFLLPCSVHLGNNCRVRLIKSCFLCHLVGILEINRSAYHQQRLFCAVTVGIFRVILECMLSWKVIISCYPVCILGITAKCMSSREVNFCCHLVFIFGITL